MKKKLISELLQHVENNAIESLLTEDGTPDKSTIRRLIRLIFSFNFLILLIRHDNCICKMNDRLFEKIDHDGKNFISQHELKELIVNIKFGKAPLNVDEVVAKVIEELDTSRDGVINEEEFVSGIAKLFNATTYLNEAPSKPETQDDIYQVSIYSLSLSNFH